MIFSTALAKHRRGETAEAARMYRQIIEMEPAHLEALSNLGALTAAAGALDEAVALYMQVLESTPDDDGILTNLGNIMQSRGDFAGAREYYQRALEINPSQAVAISNLGNVHLSTEDPERAVECYRQALEIGPEQSWVLSNLSAAYNELNRRIESAEFARRAIEIDPKNADAYNNLGSALQHGEDFRATVEAFEKAAALRPDWIRPRLNLACVHENQGEFEAATDNYRIALTIDPQSIAGLSSFAAALTVNGDLDQAAELLARALDLEPGNAELYFHQANLSRAQGELAKSVDEFARAVELGLAAAEVHNNMATSLFELRRFDEALVAVHRALELNDEFAHGYNTLGNVMAEHGDLAGAQAHYLKALSLDPAFTSAICNAATMARRLGDHEYAIELYNQALEDSPGLAAAYNGLGLVYQSENRADDAIATYDEGLTFEPDNWELLNNKAISLQAKGQANEALVLYRDALNTRPRSAEIYYNIGNILQYMQRFDESISAFNAVLQIRPDYNSVYPFLAHSLMQQCNWINLDTAIEKIVQNIAEEVEQGRSITTSPFSMLSLPVPPEHRLAGAKQLSQSMERALTHLLETTEISHKPRGDKLRIGYVSPDFRRHSLGMAFLDLLKSHDREKYEFFGYGLARGNEDEVTDWFKASFDHYTDITETAYDAAAQRIAGDGINILIDLAGHTRGARLEVFALRPAPVQAHYLGYGHTIGADFIPYLISDRHAVSAEVAAYCSESLVYLPDSFLSATRHEISDRTYTRAEFGLPDAALVLANFNGPYKIDPRSFAVWMRLLRKTPDAVLWLKRGTEGASANLRREAEARGVDAERIVFADIIPHTEHLARLKLADLALDGYYHSGGVTTTDALWAGLPVLSVAGPMPSARTGVSILQAAGLPELVASSLDEYEKILHRLANDRGELGAIREKLSATRESSAIFDSDRLARNLETAFEMMWENYQSGGRPHEMTVPALD